MRKLKKKKEKEKKKKEKKKGNFFVYLLPSRLTSYQKTTLIL